MQFRSRKGVLSMERKKRQTGLLQATSVDSAADGGWTMCSVATRRGGEKGTEMLMDCPLG
jgi:hypothetical protein